MLPVGGAGGGLWSESAFVGCIERVAARSMVRAEGLGVLEGMAVLGDDVVLWSEGLGCWNGGTAMLWSFGVSEGNG